MKDVAVRHIRSYCRALSVPPGECSYYCLQDGYSSHFKVPRTFIPSTLVVDSQQPCFLTMTILLLASHGR